MQKTIFVVDDIDTNLLAAGKALEKQYKVIPLLSAAEMFKALEKLTPDLILLDIEMPETDGFEALKFLKGNKAYKKIPVIFLTDAEDSETETKGIELGVVDFIAKPFSTPLLIKRVKNYLNIEELIRERKKNFSANSKCIKSFLNGTQNNIARIEEVLGKNGPYDYEDLLMYTVNIFAIRNALNSVCELELSAVAATLEQAARDKNIKMILSETQGFLDELQAVIDKLRR